MSKSGVMASPETSNTPEDSSIETVYPVGRTAREQAVVFNEHFFTHNPKPSDKELGSSEIGHSMTELIKPEDNIWAKETTTKS